MATQRVERVAQLLREEISRLLERGMIKDPRLAGVASITDIELTPDLRHARVFVSVYGSEAAANDTIEVLDRAKRFIRGEVGKHLRLRYIPELEFRRDDSLARGVRISELLDQVKRESPPPAEDSEDSGDDPAA